MTTTHTLLTRLRSLFGRTAAKRLRALGFDAVSLAGGMPAWEGAGGATRRCEPPHPRPSRKLENHVQSRPL